MKKLLLGITVALLTLALTSTSTSAQEDLLELMRADLRADKVAILTDAMALREAEGDAFWPIYRDYDNELSRVVDRRIALLKSYADAYPEVSEEKAAEIAATWFKIQEDTTKLLKKYHRKVENAVSAGIAARFIQVENQIGLLLQLQAAAEIPLIHAVAAPDTDS